MIEKIWDPGRIEDRLQMRAVQLRRPLSCTLELTYRCNFHCKMCYVRMSDSEAAQYGKMRTPGEWIDMARQLSEAGVFYLSLTGGECTRYPGFETLYEQLYKMGFRISLMSNAGAYTDPVRELFRKYPPHRAAISLYGGCNETYQAVTGDPEGFQKTVSNIRFFQSIGVPVSLNFTIIRQNVTDYPKVGRLCQELGIPYTLITDITSHQKNIDFSDAAECRLSPAQRACIACHPPEEVALALENAKELEKELEHFRPGHSFSEHPVTDLQGRPYVNEAPASGSDACIGSFSSCAIYWNGDMQTCISLNGYHCVKPFETGFESAWTALKAEQEKTFRYPDACRSCGMASDYLHNCAGRRFEGTHSPYEPDFYTCQYTYLLKLYKARLKKHDTAPEIKCL